MLSDEGRFSVAFVIFMEVIFGLAGVGCAVRTTGLQEAQIRSLDEIQGSPAWLGLHTGCLRSGALVRTAHPTIPA
ncbi:hypothetical protein ACMHYQ_08450 [Ectopseudomonas guguanensis]|jgi:hypothetical protein|uniref:hypothetical protein n=1 Tax=Ectopseudomonas guguanensis TaxID=1198456 RepID=UPI0039C2CA02